MVECFNLTFRNEYNYFHNANETLLLEKLVFTLEKFKRHFFPIIFILRMRELGNKFIDFVFEGLTYFVIVQVFMDSSG